MTSACAGREFLPQRRQNETFEFSFAGIGFVLTIGHYDDGRVGEIFVNALKRDSAFDALARDSAILISFALQHGAAIGDLARAMTRDAEGAPQGVAGKVLDLMAEGR